jgi:hypothetical protein
MLSVSMARSPRAAGGLAGLLQLGLLLVVIEAAART